MLDVLARRNAFGRQVRSFEADLELDGIEGGPLRAVFIRAPWVEEHGSGVEVLARVDGHPVAVREGALLAVAFHPELTGDPRLHAMFVESVPGRRRLARVALCRRTRPGAVVPHQRSSPPMAEEVQIRGTQEIAKIRNPLAPALLPFVTFGIYHFVWYYKVNKEMAELGKATGRTEELGDNPTHLAARDHLGAFIIVPPFISVYHTFQRQQAMRSMTTPGDNGFEAGLGLLIAIFVSPIANYLLQDSLNKGWQAQAGGGGQVGAGAPGGALPQQQPGQYVQQ